MDAGEAIMQGDVNSFPYKEVKELCKLLNVPFEPYLLKVVCLEECIAKVKKLIKES